MLIVKTWKRYGFQDYHYKLSLQGMVPFGDSSDSDLMFNIDPDTIKKAAIEKYGEGVLVSAPYWVDHECIRVGIQLSNDGASFGANFYYKQGKFI